MNIELRQLQYFITVAEELNFGRASKRLNMAQPPLTRQIQRLEAEVGVKLFRRTTRRVELTDAGQVYLEQCCQIMAQVQEGTTMARLVSRGEVGRLVVGYEGSSAYNIVPLSVKIFRGKYPRVNVIAYEMPTGEQLQALHSTHIRAGFIVPSIDNTEGLVAETILREPMVVALPQFHPLAAQTEVHLEDLASETFIVCPQNQQCGLYDHVISICRQAGFNPRLTQETNEMQLILGLIAAELGIAILPASVNNLQRSGVVYRTLHPLSTALEFAIAWRREDISPVLLNLLAVVRKITEGFTKENARKLMSHVPNQPD